MGSRLVVSNPLTDMRRSCRGCKRQEATNRHDAADHPRRNRDPSGSHAPFHGRRDSNVSEQHVPLVNGTRAGTQR